MKDAKTITKFIKEVFSAYSINETALFSDYTLTDRRIDDPIIKNNIITKEKLAFLSKILGMRAEDIAEANHDAAFKIFNKYPFFKLLLRFEGQKYFAKNIEGGADLPFEQNRLLYTLFGKKVLKSKYSDKDLLARLETQLKEFDKFIPGTYHPEGTITDFHYHEETLFTFPACEALLISFFEVYDRLNELFFKALKTDLSQEEIDEYNLFVSYFLGKEAAMGDLLYYDILCKYRHAYIREGYSKLSSYMRIDRISTNFEPWKCREFARNKELAQRYQDIYGSTKDRIRELCMNIKYIHCAFKWSDDPFIEEEDWIPEEYRRHQEWTRIYIPKTEEELGNDADSATFLSKFASPPSKGGLVEKRDYEVSGDTQTFFKRRALRLEGN